MQRKRLQIVLAALTLSILALMATMLLFQPMVAYAHAFVIGSDPVDGSTVSSPPSKIQIFFNAPISAASNAHVYVIENNQQVELAISSITVVRERQLTLSLKNAQSLPEGSYEITWTTIANDDGHTTYGIIGFNAGQSGLGLSGTALLGPTTSNQLDKIRNLDVFGLLTVIWDWLALLAITLWIGILVGKHFIIAQVPRLETLTAKIEKQLNSLQWVCLSILLFSEVVLLFLRMSSLSRNQSGATITLAASIQILFETNYGLLWLARLVFLLLSCILLYRNTALKGTIVLPEKVARTEYRTGPLRTRDLPEIHTTGTANLTKERVEVKRTTTTPTPARNRPYISLLLGGLILLTYALSSEIVQLQPTPISTSIFEWLSMASQGIWFGGLAYLAFLLLPVLPNIERDPHTETLTLLVQRFTPLLTASAGITLLIAFYKGEATISAPEQLINDPYGRTLLIQAILLLIVFWLSIYTLFWLHAKLIRQALLLPVVNADLPARRTRQTALGQTEQRLKKVLKVCALPGAAILLCTALLTFYAPPIKFPDITYSNPTPGAANTVKAQSKQVGDITINLQVLPGNTGSDNIVFVTLADKQGKSISDATVLLATNMQIMDMGTVLKTIEPGQEVYTANFTKSEAFSMAGPWIITVKVQRSTQNVVQTNFEVNIG